MADAGSSLVKQSFAHPHATFGPRGFGGSPAGSPNLSGQQGLNHLAKIFSGMG